MGAIPKFFQCSVLAIVAIVVVPDALVWGEHGVQYLAQYLELTVEKRPEWGTVDAAIHPSSVSIESLFSVSLSR